MPDLSGQNLDRYHLLEPLGEGGMAVVYKAFDTRLERDVAVKIIRTDAFPPNQLERVLKRFEREAKYLAKLSHPNIVGVIDFGEYQGAPYLVMEYLQGGTLKSILGKQIPWSDAVRILLPVARALDYAHTQGMIHRDVKPSNILITASGDPMLTDFGIAKILDSEEGNTLTGTGIGVGTPEYMAPEQWQGQACAQSDIYSLGIVFYEMLTGRKPYIADTPAAVLIKQINEPFPKPDLFVRDLPAVVEQVLIKAMAKDIQNRYETMQGLVTAFEKLISSHDMYQEKTIDQAVSSSGQLEPAKSPIPIDSKPPAKSNEVGGGKNKPPFFSQRWVWLVLGLCTVAIMAVACILAVSLGLPGLIQSKLPLPLGQVATRLPTEPRYLTPTATLLGNSSGGIIFWRKEKNLTGNSEYDEDFYSIVRYDFIKDNTETLLGSDGRTTSFYSFTVSPDGRFLYFSAGELISTSLGDRWNSILYAYDLGTGEVEQISITPTHTGVDEAEDLLAESYLDASRDGRYLAFNSNRENLESMGEGDEKIYLFDLLDQSIVEIPNTPDQAFRAKFSPDGERITFLAWDGEDWEIYIINIDGTNLVQLTDNAGSDRFPAWSPDGRSIIFHSDQDGSYQLYLVQIATGVITRLTSGEGNNATADWSPDGKLILFTSDRDGDRDIYIYNMDTREERLLLPSIYSDGVPIWIP